MQTAIEAGGRTLEGLSLAMADMSYLSTLRLSRAESGRLLLIVPAFPPVLSPATHRPMKLVKYLPRHGITPFVLTCAPGPEATLDRQLLTEVAHAHCRRVSVLDLASIGKRLAGARWVASTPAASKHHPGRGRVLKAMLGIRNCLMFPDHLGISVPKFCRAGHELILRERIQAICTSGPHHSVHLVGLWLKHRLRVPCWIADFRDAWVSDPKMTFPSRFHLWANQKLESAVVRAADAVVTVSECMRSDFLKRYPKLRPDKFRTIYNGFDESDFQGVKAQRFPEDAIHIVHAGTIHERSGADHVIAALGEVVAGDRALADQVRLELVGQVHPSAWDAISDTIDKWELSRVIQFRGCLPHREAVAQILGASGLLLITGPGREVVTTKVFEYIRAGLPILAICEPDAEVKRILCSAGADFTWADRNNAKGIRNVLRSWCRRLLLQDESDSRRLDQQSLTMQYSREHAAGEFARLIRAVIRRRKGGDVL